MSETVIERKCEEAIKCYLQENLIGTVAGDVPVHLAMEFSELIEPYVSIVATEVDDLNNEMLKYGGNSYVSITISIVTTSEQSTDLHYEILSSIINLIFDSDVVGYLNGQGIDALTIQQLRKRGRNNFVEGATRTTEQQIEIFCFDN